MNGFDKDVEVICTLPIETALEFIEKHKDVVLTATSKRTLLCRDLMGIPIKIKRINLKVMLKGTTCVCCGAKPLYFTIEKHVKSDKKCFLQLYVMRPDSTVDILTADHTRPVSRGGSDDFDNLQPMCSTCNSEKGNRALDNNIEIVAKTKLPEISETKKSINIHLKQTNKYLKPLKANCDNVRGVFDVDCIQDLYNYKKEHITINGFKVRINTSRMQKILEVKKCGCCGSKLVYFRLEKQDSKNAHLIPYIQLPSGNIDMLLTWKENIPLCRKCVGIKHKEELKINKTLERFI